MSSLCGRPSRGTEVNTRASWLPCSAISVPSPVSSQCLEDRSSAEIIWTLRGGKLGFKTSQLNIAGWACHFVLMEAQGGKSQEIARNMWVCVCWTVTPTSAVCCSQRNKPPRGIVDSSRHRRWPGDPAQERTPLQGCRHRRLSSQSTVRASLPHRRLPCLS